MFGNNVQLTSNSSVYLQTAMCLIISVSTIAIILSLMSSMKNLNSKILPFKKEFDAEWLNSHTLYFRGLLKHDGQGKLFEAIVNEFVEDYGGRIVKVEGTETENKDGLTHDREQHRGIFMVKNYRKYTKHQDKVEQIKDLLMFQGAEEPLLRK